MPVYLAAFLACKGQRGYGLIAVDGGEHIDKGTVGELDGIVLFKIFPILQAIAGRAALPSATSNDWPSISNFIGVSPPVVCFW